MGLIFKLKQNDISGKLLSPLTYFLKLRKHRVVLWSTACTAINEYRVNPWSIVTLVYINDLSEGLRANARFSVDNISLFSVVDNINLSATSLNSDLCKINA